MDGECSSFANLGGTCLNWSRIASPKMFLNAELLPQMARERRGNDEAIEYGEAQGIEICIGAALQGYRAISKRAVF